MHIFCRNRKVFAWVATFSLSFHFFTSLFQFLFSFRPFYLLLSSTSFFIETVFSVLTFSVGYFAKYPRKMLDPLNTEHHITEVECIRNERAAKKCALNLDNVCYKQKPFIIIILCSVSHFCAFLTQTTLQTFSFENVSFFNFWFYLMKTGAFFKWHTQLIHTKS